MAKQYGVVTVQDAQNDVAELGNEDLFCRTLEVLCELAVGLVGDEYADVYVSEMRRRGLT